MPASRGPGKLNQAGDMGTAPNLIKPYLIPQAVLALFQSLPTVPGNMLSQDFRHSMHCYRSSGANVMPKLEETGGAHSGHYGAEKRCFAFLCVVIWRFAMC